MASTCCGRPALRSPPTANRKRGSYLPAVNPPGDLFVDISLQFQARAYRVSRESDLLPSGRPVQRVRSRAPAYPLGLRCLRPRSSSARPSAGSEPCFVGFSGSRPSVVDRLCRRGDEWHCRSESDLRPHPGCCDRTLFTALPAAPGTVSRSPRRGCPDLDEPRMVDSPDHPHPPAGGYPVDISEPATALLLAAPHFRV